MNCEQVDSRLVDSRLFFSGICQSVPIRRKVYEAAGRSVTSRDSRSIWLRIYTEDLWTSTCISVYKCGSGQLLQNGRRARRRNIPGPIRISLSWHRCGGAFTAGRRRPSQPHRANCNSVETIGASGSSARRRMRDTIVKVWLVPGTFSSLTFLWWCNPPPR